MDDSEVSEPQSQRDVNRADKPETPPPASGGSEAAQTNQEEATRRQRRPFVGVIGFLVVAALAGAGYYYYQSTRGLESTDDAYIDGRAITIAPQVAGVVVSLDVTRQRIRHTRASR